MVYKQFDILKKGVEKFICYKFKCIFTSDISKQRSATMEQTVKLLESSNDNTVNAKSTFFATLSPSFADAIRTLCKGKKGWKRIRR